MYGPLADSDGLLVSVVAQQQYTLNFGQLHIVAANHKGENLAEIIFDESKLCQYLVNCFEHEQVTPFPLAPPVTTVRRAKQQNILIEINYCICGHPDTFEDMVACDGCDHWFHLSCVDMEDAPQGDWFCADCPHVHNE